MNVFKSDKQDKLTFRGEGFCLSAFTSNLQGFAANLDLRRYLSHSPNPCSISLPSERNQDL